MERVLDPRLKRWAVVGLMSLGIWLALIVLATSGCMTVEQRAFLNNTADKMSAYVDEVNRVPVAITEQAIRTQEGLTDAERARRLETLARIREYGQSLKADAATIKGVWPAVQ